MCYLGVGVCIRMQGSTEVRCIVSSRVVVTYSWTQILKIKLRSTRAAYAPNHLASSLSHAFVFFSKQNRHLHLSFQNKTFSCCICPLHSKCYSLTQSKQTNIKSRTVSAEDHYCQCSESVAEPWVKQGSRKEFGITIVEKPWAAPKHPYFMTSGVIKEEIKQAKQSNLIFLKMCF